MKSTPFRLSEDYFYNNTSCTSKWVLFKLEISENNYIFSHSVVQLEEMLVQIHTSTLCSAGLLHSHLKILAAGMKTIEIPPDYSGNHSLSHMNVYSAQHLKELNGPLFLNVC